MPSIDDLLADALIARTPVPTDVVPYEDTAYPDDIIPAMSRFLDDEDDDAALGLRALCEAVVNAGTTTLLEEEFVTEQLPGPSGARVLGCVLHLAHSHDGSRFWWQYAAGAGDDAASYCLYLHHLSQGETHAATFWRRQTHIDAPPEYTTAPLPRIKPAGEPADGSQKADEKAEKMVTMDDSTPTVLRILAQLLTDPDVVGAGRDIIHVRLARPHFAAAVMDYVPTAVAAGYAGHPDIEIPLPGPYFADRLIAILAATSVPAPEPSNGEPRPALKRRTPTRHAAASTATGHRRSRADTEPAHLR